MIYWIAVIKEVKRLPKVRTRDIIEKFQLELISGEEVINRPITTSNISRPGIEMAGYFDYYPAERVGAVRSHKRISLVNSS
mgnify:FL=1|jgi:serine kinase of HPr protein (carbohydrate metabolism regulator)